MIPILLMMLGCDDGSLSICPDIDHHVELRITILNVDPVDQTIVAVLEDDDASLSSCSWRPDEDVGTCSDPGTRFQYDDGDVTITINDASTESVSLQLRIAEDAVFDDTIFPQYFDRPFGQNCGEVRNYDPVVIDLYELR
ncbi:MAG: hypothetical protein AAFV53_28390 [Myxococcota bacterium]